MRSYALPFALLSCVLSLSAFGELCEMKSDSSDTASPLFIKAMPDFCQVSQRYGKLPNGGSQYCAPAAISNVLMWLDQQGFSALVPGDDNSCRTQFKLVELLGSENYMNTDKETGTSPIETMEGLERYVKDRGYDISIEWKGWRNGGKYAAKDQVPSIEWLKEGTMGQSNIIISVGWYTLDKKKMTYNRLGGHYVTVVGIDIKNKNTPLLYIHNPSFGTEEGKNPRPQICRLIPINSGHFGPWCEYSQHPAKGYYRLEGIPMRSDAKYAIIDGGIRFTISQPKTCTAAKSEEHGQKDQKIQQADNF